MKVESKSSNNIIGVHHVGIVVDDIQSQSNYYQQKLGYDAESGIINEVEQDVFVQFLIYDKFRIELIQPTNDNSPVSKFLKEGGGLNHICYLSNNIEKTTKYFRQECKALPISSKWSAAIKNCKVIFLGWPNGEVIEILQPLEEIQYFPPYF